MDAVVNAANQSLKGGGGVDGAIHRAAGNAQLLAATAGFGRCPTGGAVATPAFRLPAKYIFHAVGPRWRDGTKGEPDLLAGCYRRCMELAREHGVTSIAFPAISCGAYRFPHGLAAEIAIGTVRAALPSSGVADVLFVLRDATVLAAYRAALGD